MTGEDLPPLAADLLVGIAVLAPGTFETATTK